MLAYAEKMKDILFILVVTAIFSAIAHTVGSNGNLAAASIGSLFLVVIALIGIVLSQLPILKSSQWSFGFRRLLLWSLCRIFLGAPGFCRIRKTWDFCRSRRRFWLTEVYA